MNVDHGGTYVLVPQELLDGPQIRSPLQQVGGERVAQHVRTRGRRQTGRARVPAQNLGQLLGAAKAAPTLSANALEVRFVADYKTDDGRFANNGWLQECPHPITKISWDNAILVSPKLGRELVAEGGSGERRDELSAGAATVDVLVDTPRQRVGKDSRRVPQDEIFAWAVVPHALRL